MSAGEAMPEDEDVVYKDGQPMLAEGRVEPRRFRQTATWAITCAVRRLRLRVEALTERIKQRTEELRRD
jgi:hypothetical protein